MPVCIIKNQHGRVVKTLAIKKLTQFHIFLSQKIKLNVLILILLFYTNVKIQSFQFQFSLILRIIFIIPKAYLLQSPTRNNNIHLLHDCEGNMKINYPPIENHISQGQRPKLENENLMSKYTEYFGSIYKISLT